MDAPDRHGFHSAPAVGMSARHWGILLVLILAEGVSALEYSMIMAGLPVWLEEHGDPIKVGWLLSGYFLISGSSAALSARMGDIFGRKKVLIMLLGCCVAGSVISAFGPNLEWVIAGRCVQGFAGGILALCAGLVRENLPEDRVAFAMGSVVATATGGAAVGLLLGGVMTDFIGPQSIFFVTAATGAVGLMLVGRIIPPSMVRPGKHSIDMAGAAMMVPAIGSLLLAVSNLTRWTWSSLALVGGGGLVLLVIWIRHELHQAEPLINLRLLGREKLAFTNLLSACANMGASQMTTLSTLLMQQAVWTGVGLGLSATFVGALKFPGLAIGVLGSLWAGSIAGKKGGHVPAFVGATLCLGALFAGLFWHSSVTAMLILLITVSLGGSLVFAGTSAVIVREAPKERVSEATGLNVVIRALAMALGAQLVAMLLASSTVFPADGGRGLPDDLGYTRALVYMGILSAVAFGVALRLALSRPVWGRKNKRTQKGALTR